MNDGRANNCDHCPTGFSCGRLYAALHIIAAKLKLRADPQLALAYERVRNKLDAAGWKYPESTQHCDFAEHDSEIQTLTDELIAAMRGHT